MIRVASELLFQKINREANQITGASSRPASPLDAGRPLVSASCAPPFLSAAVAQFWR
jgi:hypothetical protein